MSEIWEAIQTNFVIILMVTARVSGIFTFNPIFSRNGVPNMVKAGASLMLALVMAAAGDFSYTIPQGVLPFALDIGKELLVGFTLGFFVNLVYFRSAKRHNCFSVKHRKSPLQIHDVVTPGI